MEERRRWGREIEIEKERAIERDSMVEMGSGGGGRKEVGGGKETERKRERNER